MDPIHALTQSAHNLPSYFPWKALKTSYLLNFIYILSIPIVYSHYYLYHCLIYPRMYIHVVYNKVVYTCRNQRGVGRSGANLASRTTSSVFDQFSWNLAQMCALGCRCARHIFWQWQKECCHGNGILWQKGGKNLASRTTSSVFHQFSWNLAQMFALGCRCARHIFWQWQKVCCRGNGILWQKWGENLASRTTSSVFHQFSWNLAQMFALGCKCARHIFLTVAESVLPW